MASGGGLHEDARTWQAWLDLNWTRDWSPSEQQHASLHYAFAYQLLKSGGLPGVSFGHSAAEYASKGRELFFRYVALSEGSMGFDGEKMIATYDWLYPTLSATDRTAAMNYLKTVDRQTDDGNPFVTTNVGVRANRVLTGIACHGDGMDDAWCLNWASQYHRFFREPTGVTRAESDLVGDDGGAGQGISYGFGHTMRRVLFAEEGFRTATGATLAAHYGGSDTRFLRTQPLHFAYRILPWAPANSSFTGGREYRLEKGYYMNAGVGVGEHEYSAWLNAVSGIFQTIDPNASALAQWLVQQRVGPSTGHYGILQDWVFSKFVAGPASAPTASPSDLNLPTSRRFREGRFVFRGNWDDPNATMLAMYVNEWQRSPYGMSSFLPGAFEVHRKGPQVINQGGVSGHDWGGAGRAGAANMLIFPDRTLTASTSDNDDEGGHRRTMAAMRGSGSFVQNSSHDELDTLRYLFADGSTRDFDYVYADVTRAYNSTRFNDAFNPARVSEVVRQLVYFRGASSSESAVVVVLDRATTTNTKFEKNWLFHTSAEPMVNGTVTAGQPVRGGHGDGHWTYTGATRVTATNTSNGSNGRTFLTPLLPSGFKVVKIGGPDSTGASWTTLSHEYEDPFGKRYPYASPGPDRLQYVGQYRIEIVPTTPALNDVFLNVVEVADASVANPKPTALLQGDGLVAARVGNRIAAFNRVSTGITTGSFTVDVAGSYRILLADLVPGGEYDVSVGPAVTRQTATAAGVLYLDQNVIAGTRIVVQATGAVAVTAPAAPLNVRILR